MKSIEKSPELFNELKRKVMQSDGCSLKPDTLRTAVVLLLCQPTMLTKVASTGMLTKASTVVTKVPWAMTRELPPYW